MDIAIIVVSQLYGTYSISKVMMKYMCNNNIVIVSLGVADIKFVYTPTLKQKSDYLIYINTHIEILKY